MKLASHQSCLAGAFCVIAFALTLLDRSANRAAGKGIEPVKIRDHGAGTFRSVLMLNPEHNHSGRAPLRILMAAGEVSGDTQAGHLAAAILRQNGGAELFGSGGDRMREAGVRINVQSSHLGCVGLSESIRFLRPLRSVFKQIKAITSEQRPDLAVLVDNEGFNNMVAKHLHRRGIPIVYYFAPQVWFWGSWRARGIARRARAIIPAFPAEADIYQREGGRVEWCGHPLVDIVKPRPEADATLRALGLDPARPILVLMPGSRFQELEQLAGPMFVAAKAILQRYPQMQVAIPVAASHLKPRLEATLLQTGLANVATLIQQDAYTVLSRAEVVLLSSGTGTLEAALLGVPMVVCYRVARLTYQVARCVIRTRYIAMPNILLQEEVVPELIQDSVSPEHFIEHALGILENDSRRRRIRARLGQVRPMLGQSGVLDRAAEVVLREADLAQSRRPRIRPA